MQKQPQQKHLLVDSYSYQPNKFSHNRLAAPATQHFAHAEPIWHHHHVPATSARPDFAQLSPIKEMTSPRRYVLPERFAVDTATVKRICTDWENKQLTSRRKRLRTFV